MSTLPLKDSKGNAIGEVTLSERFDVTEKGAHAVYQALVNYQAHQHQGSASTKGKGAVSGSGKKPWKQKGLGRARAGYRQSPVWRGGSVAFGPHPRKVRKKMPRKAARLAFARAFGEKAASGAVTVIDTLNLEGPRTKAMREWLQGIGVTGRVLLILDDPGSNVLLASRNLQEVEVVSAAEVNLYQVVRNPQIVMTKAAVDLLEQRLAQRG